jgi:hypothetical protein
MTTNNGEGQCLQSRVPTTGIFDKHLSCVDTSYWHVLGTVHLYEYRTCPITANGRYTSHILQQFRLRRLWNLTVHYRVHNSRYLFLPTARLFQCTQSQPMSLRSILALTPPSFSSLQFTTQTLQAFLFTHHIPKTC